MLYKISIVYREGRVMGFKKSKKRNYFFRKASKGDL